MVRNQVSLYRKELAGIVEPGTNGRLQARHELYVRHILSSICSIEELYEAWISVLEYFSGYKVPVIKNVEKLDGHLFKYLLNNKAIHENFVNRGRADLAENIFRHFELPFQLDGHYWLQYGLFQKRIGNYTEALRMLKLSTDAYSGNPFAEHAYAQQLLVHATRYAENDALSFQMAAEGVSRLQALAAQQQKKSDFYPLLTLATHHVVFLLSKSQGDQARKVAKEYFGQLSDLEKRNMCNKQIDIVKHSVFKLATAGIWEAPNFLDQDIVE